MTEPAPLPTITPDTVLPTLLVGTIGLISKLSPPHFYQSFSATNNASSRLFDGPICRAPGILFSTSRCTAQMI
jgi:hypothetical protein